MKCAAEHKNVSAEFLLGLFYQCGIGVKVDHTKAFYWYNLAADNKYEKAYSHIGRYYRDGRIVTKNYEEALKWFEKAICSNNKDVRGEALYDYGVMYWEGFGVKQNKDKAILLFAESRDLECINAINKLKKMGASNAHSGNIRYSDLLKKLNIIEYIQMRLNDNRPNELWKPNILQKLELYIECAKNNNVIKEVEGGRLKWTLSDRDFAQWMMDISNDLGLYEEVNEKKKYDSHRFAKLFINKKNEEFKPVNIRHNIFEINRRLYDYDVRGVDTLIKIEREARTIIKQKRL
jgi:hypothetical protein